MASFDLVDAQEDPPPSLSDPVNPTNQDQMKQWAEPTPMSYSYNTSRSPNLPDYVRPLPPSLESDDIEYLQKKGAFTLPDRPLMEECLRCYTLYIHPLYPTVDIVEVQSTINRGGEGHQLLSLLLLQALIFAGSMWADVRLVRNAGFLTRKAFRQSWHRKIRLLYDMDYEEDRICLVQSLLLWAFWWRGTNERKDSWHWIGVAYSIARTVDLPQEPPVAGVDGGSPTAHQQRKHRRRLWWALHTREVISSIGMSRAPRIKPIDHNVAMLCLQDFNLDDDEGEGTPQTSLMGLPPPSKEQGQALARVTVEFTKLIDIFGRILAAACPENAAGRTAVLYSAQQMEGSNHVASKRQLNIEDLNVCEQELMAWRQQLGEDLWWQVGCVLPFDPPPPWHKAELCHRGLLAMLYHLALMTIHRPQMLPAEASSPTTTTGTTTSPRGTNTAEQYRKDTSRAIVRSCAQEITKIAMDFFRADLITFLSATVVSCLMPASIHHVFDTFSEDIKLRAEANRRLEECRVMLHSLSEQQFASAWILQTIDHIIGRIKLISNGGSSTITTTKKQSQQQQHATSGRRAPRSSYGELSTPLTSIDVYPESLVIDQDQDQDQNHTQNFSVLDTTVVNSPNVTGSHTDMRTINTNSSTNTSTNTSNKPIDRSSDGTVFSHTYNSSRQEWTAATAASFWNPQQPDVGGASMSQLPLLSGDSLIPFQPDLMTNAEALEEMWMDFARVPENMAGLPGL
ncbi:uncharacterized protein PV06_09480 [Exophiala oligosperma]|uniref:Xylanolytic transcriptional activator regulatory domain-containing protein n=1 Tax=Exophiala oligosperma TaxID=215243 RepID=A0A0D2DSB3_9EURO|nr:uncharacterized protein PV06_09480 [Exophiala oligosperma]KIW38524.1 hypothetical protein PV06_09480 [Exophiala oligosperma]